MNNEFTINKSNNNIIIKTLSVINLCLRDKLNSTAKINKQEEPKIKDIIQ